MGKVETFEITLANANAVFFSGQTIEGHVTLKLNDSLKMRGIGLCIIGAASVRWQEKHTQGNRTVTTTYYSSEAYVDKKIILFGKAIGDKKGDNPIHPPGQFTYPFKYQLPKDLPSSFEGPIGRIRYLVGCTIDKPWQFDEHCKKAFTVLSVLDLNVQPDILEPQEDRNSKTLCCLCCKSGPISAYLNIDRRGYVPGEFIVLNGEVENLSNRTMKKTTLLLRMMITYHAGGKSRIETRNVALIEKGELKAGQTEEYTGEKLHIPPLPASGLLPCHIIDLVYHVMLCVTPKGPAFELQVAVPIVIGTVPMKNIFATYAASAIQGTNSDMMGADPSAAEPNYDIPNASAPAQSAPPPSYQQSQMGNVNIRDADDGEHVTGNLTWAPSYTYYSWEKPQGRGAMPKADM